MRLSIASLTGILVGSKVLSVASQTVLQHILGSRGSHIFLQIDHEIISKAILTPSAAQLQTFKNMTYIFQNVKIRYLARFRMSK